MPRISVEERFFSKTIPEPNSGCLLWTASVDRWGYGSFNIGKRVKVGAHRVAWSFVFGRIPKGVCVLHRCDTPACVNVDHLFLGTHADNAADRDAKGRSVRGEAHVDAKLTEADVRAIRKDPRTHVAVGRDYGITTLHIGDIRRRKYWKHVT